MGEPAAEVLDVVELIIFIVDADLHRSQVARPRRNRPASTGRAAATPNAIGNSGSVLRRTSPILSLLSASPPPRPSSTAPEPHDSVPHRDRGWVQVREGSTDAGASGEGLGAGGWQGEREAASEAG